jgi:hypothetical protein
MRAKSYHHTVLFQDEEESDFTLAFVAYDLSMTRQLQDLERRWASSRTLALKQAQFADQKPGGACRR